MPLFLLFVMVALTLAYVWTDNISFMFVSLVLCCGIAVHYGPWWALR